MTKMMKTLTQKSVTPKTDVDISGLTIVLRNIDNNDIPKPTVLAQRLIQVGRSHHMEHNSLDGREIQAAKVPSGWAHDSEGIVIVPSEVPNVPQIKSLGIVEGVVNKFTRKDVLEDLARTMLAGAADDIDQLGDLRISRTLYMQIKLWASRKFTETEKQKAFTLRCLYRFELTNDLAHLFKMLNPRPFGLTAEARISIQTEFGKMMKEINRLHREETTAANIPDDIVVRYGRTMGHDRKFHEWACLIGPSLVVARSKTHDLADKLWELAVQDAAGSGAAW